MNRKAPDYLTNEEQFEEKFDVPSDDDEVGDDQYGGEGLPPGLVEYEPDDDDDTGLDEYSDDQEGEFKQDEDTEKHKDSKEKEKLDYNLSKAVQEKNKKIQELQKKLKELEDNKAEEKNYMPDIAMSTSSRKYNNVSSSLLENKMNEYESFFRTPKYRELQVTDPGQATAYFNNYLEIKAVLPDVKADESIALQNQQLKIKGYIDNIMKYNPELTEKQAKYILNTADFNKYNNVNKAISESIKDFKDMVNVKNNTQSQKQQQKQRIARSNIKSSGVSEASGENTAYNKAMQKLQKKPRALGEWKELAQMQSQRNPKKYPTWKSYIKAKANIILKEEI